YGEGAVEASVAAAAAAGSPHGGLASHNFIPCDAYAVAVSLYPDLVVKTQQQLHCAVEVAGRHARGMLVFDWYGHHYRPEAHNIVLVHEMNTDHFLQLLRWRLHGDISTRRLHLDRLMSLSQKSPANSKETTPLELGAPESAT